MPFQSLQASPVTAWFQRTYAEPTPAQTSAWPLIARGENVLIVSPTGTGKTFAAFLAVLNELELLQEQGKLRSTFHALYVSPLRALNYDLEKNLIEPLREIYGADPPIRVGLRTGDTSSTERQRQFSRPPHILLTTPESLCLLLTQPKWLPLLQTVRWVIVDEIHALAESKRGAHLSLSLERLDQLVRTSTAPGAVPGRPLQRIGLSATVAPLAEISQFLAGTARPCSVVDTTTAKRAHMQVHSPLGRNPYPPSGYTGQRLIRDLARLVTANRTTLVFSNTRSGAEAATFWLRGQLPELAAQIECHHASLDRDVRQEVEDRLKRGELRAVVCSTSLELGIDIGSIDLVVMLSTPKGVSKALQRTGRSGHNIRALSRGTLMATNMNDLVECCATVLLARRNELDPIRLPAEPLDVLAQHIASMGCTQAWNRNQAFDLVRGAYPYRELSQGDFDTVLDYLAGGGKALRAQYTELFGKIELTDERFETRSGTVRRDLLQNIGVIPNEGMVLIKLKSRTLGSVEESFVRQLQTGDVFIISGHPVRLERLGLMEAFVSRAESAAPAIPRWNANKMPLSNKVAGEIIRFRSEIRGQFQRNGLEDEESQCAWIAQRLDCGLTNARIIFKMHAAQFRVSDIPTSEFLLIEDLLAQGGEPEVVADLATRRRKGPPSPPARHYFFHSLIGRGANDALSRVVALRLSRLRGGNAVATPDDYGFVLTVRPEQEIRPDELPPLLSADGFMEDLAQALARSDLLKYHFRNAAQTGLMVYRNFFGDQKSVRKLQWSAEVIFNVLQQHEPDHVLLREARRDAMHTYVDGAGAARYLAEIPRIELRAVQQVPPLSFALYATRIKEALLVEDPREMMERLYHLWWSKLEHG